MSQPTGSNELPGFNESDLRFEQMKLQCEKLKLEIDNLTRRTPRYVVWTELVPIITAGLAILGFLTGVWQYNAVAKREFMKPWLEAQREIYSDALNTVALIASTDDPAERKIATAAFWRLYQGKMILVETKPVSGLMVKIGHIVDDGESLDKRKLADLCRDLGSVMSKSMSATSKMPYEKFAANQFKYAE